MMNFCKSLLGFSDSSHLILPSPRDGLSLLVAAEFQKPANVLTSPAVKATGKPPEDKDPPGLLGFYTDVDGDGLRSCTESLGSESSDEIGVGTKPTVEITLSRSRSKTTRMRKTVEVKFPPPLPSLNRNGQRSYYLKRVRKDGRILITEVEIQRQEMLRASREDGRLRLNLVIPKEEEKEKEEEEEEKEKEEEEEEKEEEEKKETMRQCKFPLTGGDGFRRCHEMSSHHQHLWNSRCVTTTWLSRDHIVIYGN